MNYADRMYKSHDVCPDDLKFEELSERIFAIEEGYKTGSEVRSALYEARRAVVAAKYINRIETKEKHAKENQADQGT